MPRSDEAEWWFNAVYAAVQEIPRGKVTSYGHIARLLGQRMFIQCVKSKDQFSCLNLERFCYNMPAYSKIKYLF